MVTVKDKSGNTMSISVNDERYLSGELVPIWTGRKHSLETRKKQSEAHKRTQHQKGEKNSQYGTCWITKDTVDRKILKEELDSYIKIGWKPGRYVGKEKKKQNGKMAKVIRNCILDGEKIGENAFNIYRGYIFGNPYTHIRNKETKALVKVKTRDEAIAMYDKYFDAMIADESEAGKRFRQAFDELYEAYKKFDVIYLNCYCREDESCHGDIIRKKLIQRSMKEKLSNVRKP